MELVEAHLFQSRREKQHVYFNWRKQMIGCVNSLLLCLILPALIQSKVSECILERRAASAHTLLPIDVSGCLSSNSSRRSCFIVCD